MIRVVLTDIEGTTSSISFVHDVLFPYASEHLADFVRAQHADNPLVAEQLMRWRPPLALIAKISMA